MVLDKLDSLEASISKVLEELAHLRRSREELQAQVAAARSEAQATVDSFRGKEEEINRLREENAQLQQEKTEVRSRVEQILRRIPEE